MDRFSAYLVVRRHLRWPRSRNRALLAEAVMEQLAAHLGQPAQPWGVVGLLSQIDLEYARANPDARGGAAAQQARLEGLDEAATGALARWVELDAYEDASALERALVVADAAAAAALGEPDAARPDMPPGARLVRELELARGSGDAAARRLDAALSGLQINGDELANLVQRALRLVEQDLR